MKMANLLKILQRKSLQPWPTMFDWSYSRSFWKPYVWFMVVSSPQNADIHTIRLGDTSMLMKVWMHKQLSTRHNCHGFGITTALLMITSIEVDLLGKHHLNKRLLQATPMSNVSVLLGFDVEGCQDREALSHEKRNTLENHLWVVDQRQVLQTSLSLISNLSYNGPPSRNATKSHFSRSLLPFLPRSFYLAKATQNTKKIQKYFPFCWLLKCNP